MSNIGRPVIEWTPKMDESFRVMMGIPMVTEQAVADVLGISISTLNRRLKEHYEMTFDEYKQQKQAGLKLKLSSKQYEMAMKGNVAALIWLGKQWLGQKDRHETEISGEGISIKIEKDDEDL